MRREAECKWADESTAWENRPQKPARFIPGNGCRAVTANNKTTAQQTAGGYLSPTAIIILHNHMVSFRISHVVRTGFIGRLSVCYSLYWHKSSGTLGKLQYLVVILGGHWCQKLYRKLIASSLLLFTGSLLRATETTKHLDIFFEWA